MLFYILLIIGLSPSGKAMDFDSIIRGFESHQPSCVFAMQIYKKGCDCRGLYDRKSTKDAVHMYGGWTTSDVYEAKASAI